MKNVLAVVIGLLSAFVTIMALEYLSTVLFPLPEGADPTDLEWLKNNLESIPGGAMITVAIAHLIGIIIGMFVATLIAKKTLIPAYIVGVILLVGTIMNLIVIPHQTWFAVTDFTGALIGFGIGKIISEKRINRIGRD
ncbi:MAG: hypothetical protein HKN00_07640 [Flavobacteriaceae bacterium]|nr:hypothetical protein [Bacteroidia bacterium]MBT8287339.1 hypothetical protein [Bacteroidia bacterium]NNF75038.1 hypothetical protein [Flavobacteriaceae bacterium]NNK73985.1 hypothetical protein [Flavobacteriaceae bacterium]